ncbi:MAG: NAD(P)-dependent oxidoreductase [Armatimonadetes bacterium]|nr:NAD(P)-dependent oxidoreductase [Armatimonadota bacterium]
MARKRTIGFIGLGAMGSALATRLIEAGWPLIVYNRTAGATRPFASKGATVASSPREVAEDSDIVITMVSDDSAVRSVVFGDDGAIAGLGDGKTLADMTTASPGLAIELERAVAVVGAKTLDVRVSGSVEPARKGELLILVGGDSQVIERICPILDVLGRKIIRTGGHGTAAIVKLALNILLGLEMEALAEAFVLAGKAGVSPDVTSDAIKSSGVASQLITGKLKLLREGDLERRFALRLMQKDFNLALEEGTRLASPLPATAAANEVAKAGVANGFGDYDFAALYLAIAALAGLSPEPAAAEHLKEPAQAV